MSNNKKLKLDLKNSKLTDVIEAQELNVFESPERIRAFPVQSCNRFKCLSSKLVDQQPTRPNTQPQISEQEFSQSRVEFYQTVSQLIKLGNVEKQGDVACTRQLSKEDSLWQSELKEVIWLELQAWHASTTVKERDDYLVDARKHADGILADIINYRYRYRSDHMSIDSNDSGIDLSPDIQVSEVDPMIHDMKCRHENSCLSLFCHLCLERQNIAIKDVDELLERLDAIESLFPSTKAFGEQYPLYNTPAFKAWVKAMQLWRNVTVWHRNKVIGLGRRILLYANFKSQNLSRNSSNCSSSTPTESNETELTMGDFPVFRVPIASDYQNIERLSKVGHFLENIRSGKSRIYRQFIENLLKVQGLRKALHFLETLQLSCLHKANISLQEPTVGENLENRNNQSLMTEDDELKRYGYWSPETQTMGLPSYRGSYLFLARIPLDIVHEFLLMRLETKPKHPSNLSIIQLIRELKDGLSLAVVSRERYLSHIKAALWNAESNVFEDYKASISEYDTSVQSILEVYLDYLQQWVQMIHQERVQKNILKEEWTFINTITPHIPSGQSLVGNSFCEMTTLMLRGIRKQFENSFSKYNVKIRLPSCTKLEKLEMCRELQSLCTETRLNAFITIALAKTLNKDLQKVDCNKRSLNGTMVNETLCQLKFEALNMCGFLVDIVISLDQMTVSLKDLEGRLREVVHQFFKFGFEFHREVCSIVVGHLHPQLCRCLISLAQHWMNFAKTRCERGRGLRPRWAHHGFDFLSTVCEPRITNVLTCDEFEEFKRNIDECIVHVIGTSVPNSLGKIKSPTSYYSRSRELTSSGPIFRRTSSSYSDKDSMSPNSEPESPDYRNLSKSERVLEAIYKLDETFETKLKEQQLIGKIVSVEFDDSTRNFIRPRSVKFHWQRGIKIGQGRFGKVYTAVNNETGELMAMKEIALQPNDHRTIRSVALELKIFEGIKHENLVRYYGVEIHREEMLIFMELCTEGMLESLVAATESGLPEALIRRYTYQLVTAVNTLHQHSIVHRDIKSANIFLTEGGNCLKLGDFGSAVKIRAHTTVPGELQGFVGTQAYMAPEVFMKTNQEGHGRAVDVWSLGCVLVEMGSGKRPWADFDSNYQIMFKVGMGEIPAIPETLSEEGQHFATLCFVHDPKERATTTELLNHTFLAVDNDKEYTSFALPKILENFLKLDVKN